MAITDLTGTKWEFESTLSDNFSLDVSINYTSNDTSFDRLFIVFVPAANMARIIYAAGQTQTDAYNNGWLNDAFKTIEITGGTGVTNASLIAFIEAHATQVVEPTDVMISYNGSYIATMSDSGTEVLETAGTYMTDDITIDYTKSGGGTPTLQTKSVTPTESAQTVTADSGYDGLSQVTVSAMPSGTAGTPTATKGTVSNHSIAVIPRVTNTTGYITGGTKTGAAVTVFASELVSGTKSITENGTGIDVTNYTLVDVNVSGAPTLQSKTVTPSGSTLTVSPDTGYDGLSSVTVNPITLKMGVELPAAELVQSFTYNKLIVADEGVTLPAYGTSAITLKSSANLTPTVILSLGSYDYYVLARYLSKPVYNTSTIAKGREEYVFSSCAYEIVSIPANTFVASSGKKYASQNTTTLPVGALNKQLYWTSTTALAVYNGAAYSCYQSAQTPSVSSASSLSPTLTLKSPILYMRGHTTYFPQAVWNTVTDIRYQYIIEVYRVQKNTYNLNGWGISQQADHIIDCAFSTLT